MEFIDVESSNGASHDGKCKPYEAAAKLSRRTIVTYHSKHLKKLSKAYIPRSQLDSIRQGL
jgi:hypothetical protein